MSLSTMWSIIGLLPLIHRALATATSNVTSTYTVSAPTDVPTEAVKVPGDFVGFGFGQAWIKDYANTFSENLIDSVAKRMPEAPIIRMGGTVGDNFLWNPNQEEDIVPLDGESATASGTTFILGPKYFDALKRFPNARMTFQATLGPTLNASTTIPVIQHAYSAIGADRLVAIALGNEVSVEYKTAAGYVQAALQIEEWVISALNLSGSDQVIFEAVDTLSPVDSTHKPWAAEEAWEVGMNANGLVKVAAEHWYQISSNNYSWTEDALQNVLMNHSAITQRFIGLEESINYIRTNNASVQYVLSETGAAIGAPDPPLWFCDAMGSALWSVDFSFSAMVRHVDRVDDSGRPAAPHSSWVPDNSSSNEGPSVRAPFAVNAMLADFIGMEPHSVVELLVSPFSEHMTAYSGYLSETGKLDRVVLINMNSWMHSWGVSRPVRSIELSVGEDVQSVRIQRLHADQGADALGYDLGGPSANVTWAGEQWTWEIDQGQGHFPSGKVEEESLSVVEGIVCVTIPDSEAVVVWID